MSWPRLTLDCCLRVDVLSCCHSHLHLVQQKLNIRLQRQGNRLNSRIRCSHCNFSVPSAVGKTRASEEFLRPFLLETSMWQRTERAALDLASHLDSGDFVLGPRLARGTLRVCAELLHLHRRRQEEAGFVSSALLPVSAMWKNLTDKPLRAKVSWDPHLFALRCIRKRLFAMAPKKASAHSDAVQVLGEAEEDEEARTDLSEEICETAEDRALFALGELVAYVELKRAFPNWAALLIRTLLLLSKSQSGDDQDEMVLRRARLAFAEAFQRSPLVQKLAWRDHSPVPLAWLADVAEHPDASRALLRVLGRYREMSAQECCDLVEHVLLAKFRQWPHCTDIIFASELIQDLVGACLDAGRKARAPRGKTGSSQSLL
ncbi:unnamed protein product [Polarella glacialis]|uniref:Uncharacterized protein n=1 Tax=Polarella glacialis TaxID=89957 RepID=A0A813FGK7_POLGL|nr:unnamed protein product [Polarella glacialis]